MNILITGANGGMGSAITKALSKDRHTFFLQVHTTQKKDWTKATYKTIPADLTLESDILKLVDAVGEHGGIDILIHSVSLPTKTSKLFDKSWEDFQGHIDLQIKSLFYLVKYLAPSMKNKMFGRIIALASEYTLGRPPVNLSDYVTAKHALVGMIKCCAVELGEFGITANCISAGLTATPLTDHLPNKLKEMIAHQTPRKQLTTPEDVAALVRYLASNEAKMITGENVLVNGGYTMR